MIIVGADPGARHAAIVVRDGGRLVDSVYLERIATADRDAWWHACAAEARTLAMRWIPMAAGVEDVTTPNPHVGRRRADGTDRGAQIINPGPTIDTALCAGALCASLSGFCRVHLIKPAGFGEAQPSRAHLLALYPAELVGPRETTGGGKSKWQHLRAAWDVAGAAWLQVRIGAVTR